MSGTQLGAQALLSVQWVSGGQLNDPHRSPQLDGTLESGSLPAQPEPNTSAPQSPKMIAPRKRRAPGE